MLELGELRQDALGELFNIGVGRAASSLSRMVDAEVELSAPTVSLTDARKVRAALLGADLTRLSTVSQRFDGPFESRAVLVFPEKNALFIVARMLGERTPPEELSDYEEEAMCEIGNVILNACMSALADLFETEFRGELPEHRITDTHSISLFDEGEAQPYVLMLKVDMFIRQENVYGTLLFLLGVSSVVRLLETLDAYLAAQGLA